MGDNPLDEKHCWSIQNTPRRIESSWAKPPEICVLNESYLDNSINVDEDIEQYLAIYRQFYLGRDRFFLGVNLKAATSREFFHFQAILQEHVR